MIYINEFLAFLKKPETILSDNLQSRKKIVNEISFWIIFNLLFFGIFFNLIFCYLKKNQLISFEEEKVTFFFILESVFLAPLFEEMIFRFPVIKLKTRFLFISFVYISSILFGIIHLYGISITKNIPLISIIIIIPPLFGGFCLMYIRLKYNFLAALFVHMIHNFFEIIISNYIIIYWAHYYSFFLNNSPMIYLIYSLSLLILLWCYVLQFRSPALTIYFSAFIFGSAHLVNFPELSTATLLSCWFNVIPQMISGVILAKLRISKGIGYAIYFHMLLNLFVKFLQIYRN